MTTPQELAKRLRDLYAFPCYPHDVAILQAADMLEAREPMTEAERIAAWVAAMRPQSQEQCFLHGMLAAEAHHGIELRCVPIQTLQTGAKP